MPKGEKETAERLLLEGLEILGAVEDSETLRQPLEERLASLRGEISAGS